MRKVAPQKIDRVIDANFNRAREGLRVCEDIFRFIYDRRHLTKAYKLVRHQLTDTIASLKIKGMISARDITQDIGKSTISLELKRRNIADIFYANAQRTKESVRVLEEFTKLSNTSVSQRLKKIRYKIYALEKESLKEL